MNRILCEHGIEVRELTGSARCPYCSGLLPTLRDRFAMAALNDTQRQFTTTAKSEIEQMAIDRRYGGPMAGLVAICCYEMADAMMEARKTPGASTPSETPKESGL